VTDGGLSGLHSVVPGGSPAEFGATAAAGNDDEAGEEEEEK
jgi:hypothetical protein